MQIYLLINLHPCLNFRRQRCYIWVSITTLQRFALGRWWQVVGCCRYVSRIIVHDWPEAKKYLFICKTWLTPGLGTSSLDKTFTTATHSQALSFHNLFTINSLRCVRVCVCVCVCVCAWVYEGSAGFTSVKTIWRNRAQKFRASHFCSGSGHFSGITIYRCFVIQDHDTTLGLKQSSKSTSSCT